MANGGYWQTEREWQRAEGPLLLLDPTLSEFSERFGLHVTKNQKDWPERSIVWGESIRLHMQVYLASAEDLTFNLWFCASQDRGGKRYWKQETPIQGKVIAEFQNSFALLLQEGKAKLEALSEADLEFITNVASA